MTFVSLIFLGIPAMSIFFSDSNSEFNSDIKRKEDNLIKSINNGEYFLNPYFKQNILKETNKKIIIEIYQNIEKAHLTEDELLNFIFKNKLNPNEKIYDLLSGSRLT